MSAPLRLFEEAYQDLATLSDVLRKTPVCYHHFLECMKEGTPVKDPEDLSKTLRGGLL